MNYNKKKLFEVVEIKYDDGAILYDIQGQNDEGGFWSSGLFNEVELIIEVLHQIGKIDRPRVYISPNQHKDL